MTRPVRLRMWHEHREPNTSPTVVFTELLLPYLRATYRELRESGVSAPQARRETIFRARRTPM